MLNTDSIYKQGNNYHPQVYVEDECKYADAEKQQRKIWEIMMMMGFLRCKKEGYKTWLGLQN